MPPLSTTQGISWEENWTGGRNQAAVSLPDQTRNHGIHWARITI